jgi:hypothetical protein
MPQTPLSETDILTRMDDSEITKQHWKIMFISGMGFFTDAYDLFIIGVVMSILKDEWHPSPVAVGLVTFDGAAGFGVRGGPVRARRRHAGPQAHLGVTTRSVQNCTLSSQGLGRRTNLA